MTEMATEQLVQQKLSSIIGPIYSGLPAYYRFQDTDTGGKPTLRHGSGPELDMPTPARTDELLREAASEKYVDKKGEMLLQQPTAEQIRALIQIGKKNSNNNELRDQHPCLSSFTNEAINCLKHKLRGPDFFTDKRNKAGHPWAVVDDHLFHETSKRWGLVVARDSYHHALYMAHEGHVGRDATFNALQKFGLDSRGLSKQLISKWTAECPKCGKSARAGRGQRRAKKNATRQPQQWQEQQQKLLPPQQQEQDQCVDGHAFQMPPPAQQSFVPVPDQDFENAWQQQEFTSRSVLPAPPAKQQAFQMTKQPFDFSVPQSQVDSARDLQGLSDETAQGVHDVPDEFFNIAVPQQPTALDLAAAAPQWEDGSDLQAPPQETLHPVNLGDQDYRYFFHDPSALFDLDGRLPSPPPPLDELVEWANEQPIDPQILQQFDSLEHYTNAE